MGKIMRGEPRMRMAMLIINITNVDANISATSIRLWFKLYQNSQVRQGAISRQLGNRLI